MKGNSRLQMLAEASRRLGGPRSGHDLRSAIVETCGWLLDSRDVTLREPGAPEGTDGELHGVDCLQSLRAARSADETDHLVVEVRWLAITQHV